MIEFPFHRGMFPWQRTGSYCRQQIPSQHEPIVPQSRTYACSHQERDGANSTGCRQRPQTRLPRRAQTPSLDYHQSGNMRGTGSPGGRKSWRHRGLRIRESISFGLFATNGHAEKQNCRPEHQTSDRRPPPPPPEIRGSRQEAHVMTAVFPRCSLPETFSRILRVTRNYLSTYSGTHR